jgi:hypothetical protein
MAGNRIAGADGRPRAWIGLALVKPARPIPHDPGRAAHSHLAHGLQPFPDGARLATALALRGALV